MRKFLLGFMGLLLLLPVAAQAEEEAFELEKVVVTATKTEQEEQKVSATVDVVTGEELERSNASTIDEAFRRLPGILNDRTAGIAGFGDQHGGIVMRGVNQASQTLVLVDGHVLNNYEGEVQWWNIPVEDVERIEIVRGPASSLYGAGAMAGVVNIITKDEASPLAVSLSKGSFDTHINSVSHSAKLGNVTHSLSFKTVTTDGPEQEHISKPRGSSPPPSVNIPLLSATGATNYYMDGYNRTALDSTNLTAGIKWDLDETSYLRFKYAYAKNEWNPEDAYNADGSDITGNYKLQETHNYTVRYYDFVTDDVELIVDAGLTDNKKDRWKMYPSHSSVSDRPNSHYNLAALSNIYLGSNTLSVGADFQQSEVDTVWGAETISAGQQWTGTLINAKMKNAGLYVQDQWDATDALTMIASLRYDYWKGYDAEGFDNSYDRSTSTYYSSLENANIQGLLAKDNTEWHISPKVGLSYRPDDKTVVRTSLGDSFRAPSLWDIYNYSYDGAMQGKKLPNPALKPELTRTFELGLEREILEGLNVGGVYFYSIIKDMIYEVDTPMLGGNADDSQNQNIGKAYSRGYELTVDYDIADWISLFGNATYTDTKITAAPYSSPLLRGKRFREVPKYAFNTGVTLEHKGFYSDLIYRYVGDRYAEDDNSDVLDNLYGGYDEYGALDINLGYKRDHFEIKASVTNAFDRDYWENQNKNDGRTVMLTFTAKI